MFKFSSTQGFKSSTVQKGVQEFFNRGINQLTRELKSWKGCLFNWNKSSITVFKRLSI